jgi:hypothetical protein
MRDLAPNDMARPYRALSVQETDLPLQEAALREFMLSRLVYRRTEFIAFVNGDDRALIQVDHATERLFEPVTDMRLVAGPAELRFVHAPMVNTANATQMAQVALAQGDPARVFVVEGLYQHVNFIVEPTPVTITVLEVVPPEPPKLLEMARRVIDFDEELPPIELLAERVDMEVIARAAPAPQFLFPCRCSGLQLETGVDFLDAGPPARSDWTLVGCERSRQIHEALYGGDPAELRTMCPREHADAFAGGPLLLKCCLREREVELDGPDRAIVPWGASLDEVREALHALARPRVQSAA